MSQQMYSSPQAPMGGSDHQIAVRNGLGTAALVLGIIGAVSGLVPLLFWLAGILGILALVFGLVGRSRAKRGQATNKGLATTGAVLGLVSLVLSVVGVVITVTAVGDAVNEIDKAVGGSSAVDKRTTKDESDSGKAADGKNGPSAETYAAGDTVVYDDDIEVTVSKATVYTPGDFAVGHTRGNKSYKVTVRIQNKGTEKFDTALTTVEARAGKDGETAEQIFDDKIGAGFTGTILPGKVASVDFAFDTPADAANLDVEVAPGIDHDATQWELKL